MGQTVDVDAGIIKKMGKQGCKIFGLVLLKGSGGRICGNIIQTPPIVEVWELEVCHLQKVEPEKAMGST